MARARDVPELDCDAPFALAAARVVAVRGAEMFEHSHDVHDLGDIERVHDMRVATRRLRAALEVFEPAFPRKRFRATLREVKEIADALGRRRDPDVEIEMLEAFASEAGPADRPGLEAMIEPLRDEQRRANEELRPFVARDRLAALKSDLDGLVARARARAAPEPEPLERAEPPEQATADPPATEVPTTDAQATGPPATKPPATEPPRELDTQREVSQ